LPSHAGSVDVDPTKALKIVKERAATAAQWNHNPNNLTKCKTSKPFEAPKKEINKRHISSIIILLIMIFFKVFCTSNDNLY